MNLAQAKWNYEGNVGTAITAQLVAFKLTDIAPLFVFVGAMIVMLQRYKEKRNWEYFKFGILFISMGMMSEAMILKRINNVPTNIINYCGQWYLIVPEH